MDRGAEREGSTWWRRNSRKPTAAKLVFFVFIFDLIAFVLAVAGAAMRNKATITQNAAKSDNNCVYHSQVGTGLGLCAFILICASQVFMMAATRCICCSKALKYGCSCSKAWAIILIFVSWFTYFLTEICLLAGSRKKTFHSYVRNNKTVFGDEPVSCQTQRKLLFGAGAFFIVITSIVQGLYYCCYSKAKKDGLKHLYGRDTVVAMESNT